MYKSVTINLNNIIKYFPNIPIIGDDIRYWEGVKRAVFENIRKYNLPHLDIDTNCYALLYNNNDIFYTNKSIQNDIGHKSNKELCINFIYDKNKDRVE